jgi:hypothetical protein
MALHIALVTRPAGESRIQLIDKKTAWSAPWGFSEIDDAGWRF